MLVETSGLGKNCFVRPVTSVHLSASPPIHATELDVISCVLALSAAQRAKGARMFSMCRVCTYLVFLFSLLGSHLEAAACHCVPKKCRLPATSPTAGRDQFARAGYVWRGGLGKHTKKRRLDRVETAIARSQRIRLLELKPLCVMHSPDRAVDSSASGVAFNSQRHVGEAAHPRPHQEGGSAASNAAMAPPSESRGSAAINYGGPVPVKHSDADSKHRFGVAWLHKEDIIPLMHDELYGEEWDVGL